MRVIKHGTPPETGPIRTYCRNCGAVLEFEPREARTSPDPRDDGVLVIDCPDCHREIWTQR